MSNTNTPYTLLCQQSVSMQAPCRHSSGFHQIRCDWLTQSVLVPLGCSQLITVCRHTHNRLCRLWCEHPRVTGYSRGYVWVCVCASACLHSTKLLACFENCKMSFNIKMCVWMFCLCINYRIHFNALRAPKIFLSLSLCTLRCFEMCILAGSQQQKLLAPKVTKYSKEYKCVCGWPIKNSAGMLSLVIWQRTTRIIIPQLS